MGPLAATCTLLLALQAPGGTEPAPPNAASSSPEASSPEASSPEASSPKASSPKASSPEATEQATASSTELTVDTPPAPTRPVGPDLSELAKELRKSVVGIEVDLGKSESQGSGFIIRSDGWVATNHHVIDGATTITLVLDHGVRVPVVGVIAQSEEHDLAILKVEQEGLAPLALGDSGRALQGSRVVILGNPVGLGFSLSEGIVSAIREQGVPDAISERPSWKQRLIQTTAPISPGSSGSPAVDLDRQVVGVAMGIHTRGQNVGFLIPVERLKDLMAEAGAAPAAAPLGDDGGEPAVAPVGGFPLTNLIISLSFFATLGGLWWWLRRPKAKGAGPSKKNKTYRVN